MLFVYGSMAPTVTHIKENQTRLGNNRKFGAHRSFEGSDLLGSYAQSACGIDLANGWHSNFSFAPGRASLVDIAAGLWDARFKSWVRSVPAGATVDIACGHEIDLKVRKAGFLWSEWNNAYTQLRVLMEQMRSSGTEQVTTGRVRLASCLTAQHWRDTNGASGSALPTFDACDQVTADIYGYQGREVPSGLGGKYLQWLQAYNRVPGGVWEHGARDDISGIPYKVDWIHAMTAWAFTNGMDYVMAWDSGKNDTAGSMNIFTLPEYFTAVAQDIDSYQNAATTRPPAPVITSPTEGRVFPAGTSPIIISGTAGKLAAVTVKNAGGSVLGDAVTDGAGGWTYNRVNQPAGSYGVKAMATRASDGVTSLDSDVVSYSVGALPAAPVITAPTEGQLFPAGTSPVTISGTAPAGATVTVRTGAGATVGTTVAGSAGAWSLNRTGQADGGYIVRASATVGGVESLESGDRSYAVGGGLPIPTERRSLGGRVFVTSW